MTEIGYLAVVFGHPAELVSKGIAGSNNLIECDGTSTFTEAE